MHHAILEQWSRGSSVIHRRDPRAKSAALFAFLLIIATAHRSIAQVAGVLFLFLAATILIARLPLLRMLSRACLVLIFSSVFAFSAWLAGDPARAVALMLKSYLSGLAVLIVVSTTPAPSLLRGLESIGVPAFLLTVTQFVYRYLFVMSEEAQHVRRAAASRGGAIGFRAAAAAVAALFARSYERAQNIQRAMLARGFNGRFLPLENPRFRFADTIFIGLAALLPLMARLTLERMRD